MEESDFFNNLRIFDEDFEEELLKYPKYCLLLLKPFDNVWRINFYKYEEFINCITHLQSHHPDRYFTDSAQYKIDLTQSGKYHSIIRQMNFLFFVEFEVKNNTVYITVQYLNGRYRPYHEIFTVEFKQNRSLVKEEEVTHKGTGHVYTLEFNASDLSIIGDITQTEVFISIENYITCESCGKLKKYFEGSATYKTKFRCFKCRIITDARCRNFSYNDCDISDYLSKLQKHTHFFCPYESMCYICHKNMCETSFPLHYQKYHQDITYEMGDDIRIQATPGRYCLLRWSADTFLLMRYHLDNEELFLAVRSPWTSLMLVDYICSVTVSTQEQTETLPLYPLLREYDDWRLSVGKWMFKKWNKDTEFTVIVDIQRIPSEESDAQIEDNTEDAIVLD